MEPYPDQVLVGASEEPREEEKDEIRQKEELVGVKALPYIRGEERTVRIDTSEIRDRMGISEIRGKAERLKVLEGIVDALKLTGLWIDVIQARMDGMGTEC